MLQREIEYRHINGVEVVKRKCGSSVVVVVVVVVVEVVVVVSQSSGLFIYQRIATGQG